MGGVVENNPEGAGRGHPKHLGEYRQLPWGVCSTTLGSMFTTWGVCYPWEYVQLPWGVCSTTPGSMFTTWGVCYPGEYVQHLGSMLPLGVCATTIGSMFNYPGEYV